MSEIDLIIKRKTIQRDIEHERRCLEEYQRKIQEAEQLADWHKKRIAEMRQTLEEL